MKDELAYIKVKFASLICKTSFSREEASRRVQEVMPDLSSDFLKDFKPFTDIGENHVR